VVVLRPRTGLTAKLQGFRIGGTGGMAPFAKSPRQNWIYGVEWCGPSLGPCDLAVAMAVYGESRRQIVTRQRHGGQ
jgi:hypothetical protein